MARTDQGEAVVEILLVFLFLGQRLKIGKEARRPVVAGRVAAFDFLLDFTPDALAASLDLVKPNAASFFGFLGLPASFCFQTLGQAAFSCFRNLLRPLAQRSGRTARRRYAWTLLADAAPEFGGDMNVTLGNAQQQLGLVAVGGRCQYSAQIILGRCGSFSL